MSDPLVKYFKRKSHSKIWFWLTSRAYIYARFAVGMIMYVYQESVLETILNLVHMTISPIIVFIIAIAILCAVRMLATIMGPPTCGLEFDPKPEEIFQFERMFWPEVRHIYYLQLNCNLFLFEINYFILCCVPVVVDKVVRKNKF